MNYYFCNRYRGEPSSLEGQGRGGKAFLRKVTCNWDLELVRVSPGRGLGGLKCEGPKGAERPGRPEQCRG